jgi:hypothetical protein
MLYYMLGIYSDPGSAGMRPASLEKSGDDAAMGWMRMVGQRSQEPSLGDLGVDFGDRMVVVCVVVVNSTLVDNAQWESCMIQALLVGMTVV